MAKKSSRTTGARRSSRGSATPTERSTSSRRTAPAEGRRGKETETASQSDDDGIGLEGALGIATTVMLVAALVVMDLYVASQFDKGIFF